MRPAVEPNGNEGLFPASVGEDVDVPGDASGVQLMGFADLPPATPLAAVIPSPWSGYPAEWLTPRWNNAVNDLVDTACMCLDLNSSVVASMPAYLVGASSSFENEASWLDNPDPDIYTSWWEFFRSLIWDYELGESYLLATARNRFGYPARFHVLEPWMVNVEMVNGLRSYTIGGQPVSSGPGGDLLHLRYKSTAHCAHGQGPLEWGRYRFVAAAALVRYATTLVSAGGIPPGILEGDESVSASQARDVQEQWHQAERMGLIRVTFGGVKWRDVQFSPKDMALTELEQLNSARIASLLRVPPYLVGLPQEGQMVYSNAAALFDFHWRAHLRTIVDGVLRAMSAWLTPRGARVEVNREDYVAPTPTDAATIASTLHGIQETDADGTIRYAMSLDEIRARQRLTNQSPAELVEGVLR